MRMKENSKIIERRKKRMFIPTIYFLAEMIVAWLVLSLIQVNFDIRNWSLWSLIIFIIFIGYALAKTVHIYKRQKNYKR